MKNEEPLIFNSMVTNYEEKTLENLKEMRKKFDLTRVPLQFQVTAYLCRMIDILLEKIEQLVGDQ